MDLPAEPAPSTTTSTVSMSSAYPRLSVLLAGRAGYSADPAYKVMASCTAAAMRLMIGLSTSRSREVQVHTGLPSVRVLDDVVE